MSGEENLNVIPPEDFAEAIAAFRANPDVDFMFTNAPQGAKLFLGLLFYKAHFRESADDAQIQQCRVDIEDSLDGESIDYLLDCDIEVNTKNYLKVLRARKAQEAAEAAAASDQDPGRDDAKSRIDYNFEAIKKRLADREAEEADESRREAELNAMLRRKKLVAAGLKVLAGLLLLGAGSYGYMKWREIRVERAAEAAERQRLEAERQREEAAEIARQREKAEAEAAQRRKEQAENLERRRFELERKRAERARADAEREARDAARREENEKKMREASAKRERYDSVRESYGNAAVDAWGSLGGDTRKNVFELPGFFLVPDEYSDGVFYEVRVSSGETGIFRLSRSDADVPVDKDFMTAELLKKGALYMAADKKVYCITPHRDAGSDFSVSGYDCSPADLVLGDVWRLMERYRMSADSLVCEVSYVPEKGKGKRGAVRIGSVELGKTLVCSEMAEQVADELLRRNPTLRKKARGKRPTVVFYDGEILKKGINGVTYVPRSPRGNFSSDYFRLRDEARRQEAAMEDLDRDAERAVEEKRERMIEEIKASFGANCISVRLVSRH